MFSVLLSKVPVPMFVRWPHFVWLLGQETDRHHPYIYHHLHRRKYGCMSQKIATKHSEKDSQPEQSGSQADDLSYDKRANIKLKKAELDGLGP